MKGGNEVRCKHFETCSAPLRPCDPDSLRHAFWYPSEDICRRRGPGWISAQRRIKRVTSSLDTGYFRKDMLDKITRVKPGIKGIDPDGNEQKQVDAWFRSHPDECRKVVPKQSKVREYDSVLLKEGQI